MATQQDVYRKPERNMWDFLVEHANKGVQPDLRRAALPSYGRACRRMDAPAGVVRL